MQDEVEKYHKLQKDKKEKLLEKYADKTFVHDGLMWQDMKINEEIKMNMIEQKIYCRDLVLADRKDWRLPTFYELLSLVKYDKSNPSSLEKIRYIKPASYLSSSKDIQKKAYYWVVDFREGLTTTQSELERYYGRCVRTLSTKKGEY